MTLAKKTRLSNVNTKVATSGYLISLSLVLIFLESFISFPPFNVPMLLKFDLSLIFFIIIFYTCGYWYAFTGNAFRLILRFTVQSNYVANLQTFSFNLFYLSILSIVALYLNTSKNNYKKSYWIFIFHNIITSIITALVFTFLGTFLFTPWIWHFWEQLDHISVGEARDFYDSQPLARATMLYIPNYYLASTVTQLMWHTTKCLIIIMFSSLIFPVWTQKIKKN